MKKLSLICLGFLAVVAVLGISPIPADCQQVKYGYVPVPPDFVAAKNKSGEVAYLEAKAIEKYFRSASKELRGFYSNREIEKYILPEHVWLEQLIEAFLAIEFFSDVGGKPEIWDCDNFSALLSALATIRMWKAGYIGAHCAIGWIKVDAKKEWAGVPPQSHALVFAVTSKGVFVIEPQNGQLIHLQDYPNREYIQEVYLF
ncbi:MAG: hypothetical protein GY774_11440 [Planctomycetes bacterium]|nr:hypothetical protein [Planctomycetota bacterium]